MAAASVHRREGPLQFGGEGEGHEQQRYLLSSTEPFVSVRWVTVQPL
jgi:hypothetical protein